GSQSFRGTYPQFPSCRVGQILDLADARSKIVENGRAPLEQGATIERRFDAMRAAIEQAHAEGTFEVGDYLGYDRLCNRKALGRLPHAARLHDRQQDIEMAQLETAADLFGTTHRLRPFNKSMCPVKNRSTFL